jgi:hypothetical protein
MLDFAFTIFFVALKFKSNLITNFYILIEFLVVGVFIVSFLAY